MSNNNNKKPALFDHGSLYNISTDPPAPSKAPPKQSPGKKKEIITKHDSTVCGRRNVKIMEKVGNEFKS